MSCTRRLDFDFNNLNVELRHLLFNFCPLTNLWEDVFMVSILDSKRKLSEMEMVISEIIGNGDGYIGNHRKSADVFAEMLGNVL